MNDETMGLEESAKLARVGLDCWTEVVNNGEVPAARLNQKHWVLLREDVIDFIRKRGREQARARRAAFEARNKPTEPAAGRSGGRRRKALPKLQEGQQ